MAGGEAVLERLTHPEVADFLVRGARFIKWDEDSTVGQQCTVKVDSAGHLIYWRAEDKETDLLELTFVRDVRTGKSARIPKEQTRLRDSLRFGGSEDDLLQDKTITIVHGSTMVDIVYVNFVSGSVSVAREWTDALMRLMHNLLAVNASPMTFLEKHFTKLSVQTSADGKIPVKNIVKYVRKESKEDKKRVLDALQSVGLPHGKKDHISQDKFSFEDFWAFYNRLCDRKDIDKIFAEIGAKKKPYLTVNQLVEFLNNEQRDPRLNEILFPYCTSETAQVIINKYEPNKDFAKKGHFSVQGLTRYLMSEDNFIINHDRLSLHQDMSHPLSHYFVNSSHNTYLTGHQLTGKSSVEMYRQVLLAGCRCIELDCWDGKTEELEPVITHGMTLCTEILFKDVIEAIADCAFKTSEYPIILSFENHCSPKQQAKMAAYCVSIFGDMLLDKPLDEYPLEEGKTLPHPKALLRKIVIKNKKKAAKREEGVDLDKSAAEGSTPVTSPDGKVEAVDGEVPTENGNNNIPDNDKDEDEVAPETELSALVNYIQPVHFKGFEDSEKINRSFEMSSFVETGATVILKESPVEFVNYNKRQLSRIYPRGTRVGSENYMPQIFWNAGCQLVALNYQTLDLPMMLNQGIFEYNGRCGYILKPSFMCRADKSFDPFAESTVDGIIAGAVTVKVISGQWLSDKKVGTYVEVDMYGLPADTVRRKYKTKVVPNNTINPVYDEEPFVFKKVVLPSLAVLRIAVYEEGGKQLIGQRILPVDGLSPGYRHIKLRNESNQPLCLPTLFVHIVTKDYVPSGFEDFAAALCDPIAYHQEEKRQEQLKSLLDEEDLEDDEFQSEKVEEDGAKPTNTGKPANSVPGKDQKRKSIKRNDTNTSLTAEVPPNLSQRRGSDFIFRENLRRDSSRDSISGMKNPIPHPITARSLSLQAPPVMEKGPLARRARSTKRREGKAYSLICFSPEDTKVEPASISELKEQKAFTKLNQKHQKDMDVMVKRHEKEKEKLQKNHLLEQEKLLKDLDKEKVSTKKKSEKELKKTEKKGNYEETYRKRVEEMNNLVRGHETKINALKRIHRDAMIELLRKQLNEQLELAEKQLHPKKEELERLMRLSQEEKMKALADVHAKQMNDLRKGQDDHNRQELKLLSRQHPNRDELQRRKREENKKHIEQSVKERQKMVEFHKKESEELEKEHDKLFDLLDEDRKKNLKDLTTLHETKLKHLTVCNLEATYASLFGDKVTKL